MLLLPIEPITYRQGMDENSSHYIFFSGLFSNLHEPNSLEQQYHLIRS
jgi:hypothetical protein